MSEVSLPNDTQTTNYEELAFAELEKASGSTDPDHRHAHLDQASIFATLSERQRRDQDFAEQKLTEPE